MVDTTPPEVIRSGDEVPDEGFTEMRAEVPPEPTWLGVDLDVLRWITVGVWAAALACYVIFEGVPIGRLDLIFWTFTGILAASIGRRPLGQVLVDWLPFSLILVAYDFTRGLAAAIGSRTWWTPQLDADKWLFGGNVPTAWLQSHLKAAEAPWWEVIVSSTYVSYFFAPYLIAGLLWLRNRALFHRFVIGFVAINLTALVFFVVAPAAPPWAAAHCTAIEVADHPDEPACLDQYNDDVDNGLIGPLHVTHRDASVYVERVGTRGFERYGLNVAAGVVTEGQASSNEVAAFPSLHAGLSLFLAMFLWPLLRRRWRPLLVVYPLIMAFSLVYSAEHYVVDILAGWLVTVAVCAVTERVRRRRRVVHLASADRLDASASV